MTQDRIKELIETCTPDAGIVETGLAGVQVFRVTDAMQCAPAIYEPTLIAIVSGTKEAILDGKRYAYDKHRYMCCTMSMPVEAGTPEASPDAPLLGVLITLNSKVLTELTLQMESAGGAIRAPNGGAHPQGLSLARWEDDFEVALLRLLQATRAPTDRAVLGESRLREVFYALLKGEAGASVRRAFGVGNEIARAIDYLSNRLDEPVTIDDMAAQVGMSRAVLHRKFKQATSMSPIQFVKSMRLNSAAMKIAKGMTVNEAAMNVGYVSSSQFSREFKRMYGQSPRQWSQSAVVPMGMT